MAEIFLNPFEAIRAFLLAGGNVLLVIMIVTFIMWALIVERIIFFATGLGALQKRVERQWASRPERHSWYAHAIREKLISEVDVESRANFGVIKGLVAVSPLLGLLGTVTGMIEVFDVMAVTGSSNARLMAGGISKATIPTMAGLVASLSGIIAMNFLERQQKRAVSNVSSRLALED
ncbi:MotA/TolQ/ExbB proton channel family protein [Parvularcula lutaonensis]|uniref:MotA/TolQ/ExbB proton channel family protein n=1 Tax=Parvularcula lutaonensis TaxID=491923 RepID=A0ABV7M8R3_9PROT|nr:MotA/TolQ/ExbB proton channel family protein [Parvularcula lutaonensis]GGY42730.1 TonB2 energy transduction system inner membrane component ExbB [Parvularcula lutaonensis]